MFYPVFIPTFYNTGGGRNMTPGEIKFGKRWFFFSLVFGIYGFSRGYRAINSTNEYKTTKKYDKLIKEKENEYKQIECTYTKHQLSFVMFIEKKTKEEREELKNKLLKQKKDELFSFIKIYKFNKKTLMTNKISYGIEEGLFHFLPFIQLFALYSIIQRIDLFFNVEIDEYDNYENKKKFATLVFGSIVCYDII